LSSSSNKISATSNFKVRGVETDLGVIECEYFVNCSGTFQIHYLLDVSEIIYQNLYTIIGIWAREIGKLSEPHVKVPICPAEHFFLTFKGGSRF